VKGVRRDVLLHSRRALGRRRPEAGNPFLEGLVGIAIVSAVAVGFGIVGFIAAALTALFF